MCVRVYVCVCCMFGSTDSAAGGAPSDSSAAVADSGGVDRRAECTAPQCCAASRPSACCHGGAKMAVLAYSLGKREINHHFTIKNAKLISLVAVLLLLVFHTASRYYGGKCFCGLLKLEGTASQTLDSSYC